MLDLHRAWEVGFLCNANASHTLEQAHITIPYVFIHLRLFPFLE